MFELNDLQCDSLMETFNIGVGRASRSLALLLGCETALSVPVILKSYSVTEDDGFESMRDSGGNVCMVSRDLGVIGAKVILILCGSKENVASLVSLPSQRPTGDDERKIIASKIAYLVSESCIDQVEDLMGCVLTRGDAQFSAVIPPDMFAMVSQGDSDMLIIKIDLAIKKRNVSGHLLMAFSHASANRLAEGLDRLMIDGDEH